MEHPSPLDMALFIEGELEPGQEKLVWQHLDCCPDCVEWLADVVRLRREKCANCGASFPALSGHSDIAPRAGPGRSALLGPHF